MHRDNNMRAAIIHVIADATVSGLVITGMLFARFNGWLWMDPMARIVGSLVIASWHQTNLMAELRQLTRPIMYRGAGSHANKARRQIFEKRYYLAATKLPSDDDLLGRVNAVNLEYILGEIQTDRANLHVDGDSAVGRSPRRLNSCSMSSFRSLAERCAG
jgi:hypothetical protein